MLNIHQSRRIVIEADDDDFDILREIVRLARERLYESPVVQLRGCGGLERRSGIDTPLLSSVEQTIDRLSKATGLPPTYTYIDEPAPIQFFPLLRNRNETQIAHCQ